MKSLKRDDSERLRKWWRTKKQNWRRIMRGVPQTFAVDLLTLAVCQRFAESLLTNTHVKKYLMRHHPAELSDLERLLTELNGSD